jgi:histone H3/H4
MAKKKAKRGGRGTATARKKKKTTSRKKKPVDLIISKSRTKGSSSLNVSGDFYGALDSAVRELIKQAEARAENNGRRTLRPHDL